MWMHLDINGKPNGWSLTDSVEYIPVADEIWELHKLHPDYVWNGTTLVEAASVVYEPDPAAVEAQRVSSLWQAAHDYEYKDVSGSAIGLITLGVLQSKPKCIAVMAWIKSIWTEYYLRKGNGSTDCDYSSTGDCPYTIPELMTELGYN